MQILDIAVLLILPIVKDPLSILAVWYFINVRTDQIVKRYMEILLLLLRVLPLLLYFATLDPSYGCEDQLQICISSSQCFSVVQ